MKIGTITINKEFTTLAQVAKVKEDIKEFRALYTLEDVFYQFMSAISDTEDYFPTYGDLADSVICCKVNAFPSGLYFNNITSYDFEITIEQYTAIYKVQFYIDQDFRVDTRPLDFTGNPMKMYSVVCYKRQ